jgi:branched-chain amino acid transport system ATP-binding protein
MLRVESVKVGYGDLVIIDNLSLNVQKGETVALIGANGAGKTTLQRAICGLEPLRDGRVFFENINLMGMPTYQIVKLGLVLVPSNARVFGKFSVGDNLLMGSLASVEPARSYMNRLKQIYDLFPILQERSKQRAETLSGGERQMLAMGRALMSEPKFLMMDEPTAGLAPKLVGEVFGFIKRLREVGLTFLVVEEKVEHALRASDRAYVLQNGRIVFNGTSKEVRSSGSILKAYIGGIIKSGE